MTKSAYIKFSDKIEDFIIDTITKRKNQIDKEKDELTKLEQSINSVLANENLSADKVVESVINILNDNSKLITSIITGPEIETKINSIIEDISQLKNE